MEELKKYFAHFQVIMHDNGITQICMDMINSDSSNELCYEAIKLLLNLLSSSNKKVKTDLLKYMQQKRDNFEFFSYMKRRIQASTDRLIAEILEQTVGIQDRKEARQFGMHTQSIFPA